jgi:hypothetical protein
VVAFMACAGAVSAEHNKRLPALDLIGPSG